MKVSVIILLAMSLLSCKESNEHKTQPLQKITIACTLQPESSLVHIAMHNGYFTEQGLEIKPQLHTFGKSALTSILDRKADLATVAETPVVFAVLNGEKIAVIAKIVSSNKNNAIIARRDREIASPKDLIGKRVAVTPGTSGDFFMDSFFIANGILRKDVHIVGLKPEEMFDALTTGKTDAAATWNFPLLLLQKGLGNKGITFSDNEIYTETFNIVGQQDFVTKHPEIVQKFLRALIRADQFVDGHPEEAQGIVSAALHIDKNLVHEVWNGFNFHVSLDQSLLVVLEDETRWAIKNNLTKSKEMPNYFRYINANPLRAVDPSRVRIMR